MQYFGADGKALMKLRLPLLVAAALIFAPYQAWGKTPGPAEGADLAARVLAPPFDEGAIRSPIQELSQQLTSRHTTRLIPDPKLGHPIAAVRAGVTLSVLWLLSQEQSRDRPRFHRSPRLSRGPPLLQLA
jgi:hypothetical protein